MSKYLYSALLLCLLFCCNSPDADKKHLIADLYSYSSLSSIQKDYEGFDDLNEFSETNYHSAVINNFIIDSIKTTAHIDFYDKKLMSVILEINHTDTSSFDRNIKKQVLEKYINFEKKLGSCFIDGIIIEKPTISCYCWYDERLLKLYDKTYNKAN